LYRVSWIISTGIVTCIACAFSARSSSLQILTNSFRRHIVQMLLYWSSVKILSLLFGFCAACILSYRCIQMEWWTAVLCDCRCHPFPACTVDLPVCFNRQYVSAQTLRSTSCWLYLAYFGQLTSCWRNSCHSHPETSPSTPWNLFVTQILSQHKLSCIRHVLSWKSNTNHCCACNIWLN